MGPTGYAIGIRSQIQRHLNLTPEVLLMHRDNTWRIAKRANKHTVY
jgi:hypothetical protein